MIRFIVLGVIVVAVVGVGIVVWVGLAQPDKSAPPAASPSRTYDTSGGQQMQPRWNQ